MYHHRLIVKKLIKVLGGALLVSSVPLPALRAWDYTVDPAVRDRAFEKIGDLEFKNSKDFSDMTLEDIHYFETLAMQAIEEGIHEDEDFDEALDKWRRCERVSIQTINCAFDRCHTGTENDKVMAAYLKRVINQLANHRSCIVGDDGEEHIIKPFSSSLVRLAYHIHHAKDGSVSSNGMIQENLSELLSIFKSLECKQEDCCVAYGSRMIDPRRSYIDKFVLVCTKIVEEGGFRGVQVDLDPFFDLYPEDAGLRRAQEPAEVVSEEPEERPEETDVPEPAEEGAEVSSESQGTHWGWTLAKVAAGVAAAIGTGYCINKYVCEPAREFTRKFNDILDGAKRVLDNPEAAVRLVIEGVADLPEDKQVGTFGALIKALNAGGEGGNGGAGITGVNIANVLGELGEARVGGLARAILRGAGIDENLDALRNPENVGAIMGLVEKAKSLNGFVNYFGGFLNGCIDKVGSWWNAGSGSRPERARIEEDDAEEDAAPEGNDVPEVEAAQEDGAAPEGSAAQGDGAVQENGAEEAPADQPRGRRSFAQLFGEYVIDPLLGRRTAPAEGPADAPDASAETELQDMSVEDPDHDAEEVAPGGDDAPEGGAEPEVGAAQEDGAVLEVEAAQEDGVEDAPVGAAAEDVLRADSEEAIRAAVVADFAARREERAREEEYAASAPAPAGGDVPEPVASGPVASEEKPGWIEWAGDMLGRGVRYVGGRLGDKARDLVIGVVDAAVGDQEE